MRDSRINYLMLPANIKAVKAHIKTADSLAKLPTKSEVQDWLDSQADDVIVSLSPKFEAPSTDDVSIEGVVSGSFTAKDGTKVPTTELEVIRISGGGNPIFGYGANAEATCNHPAFRTLSRNNLLSVGDKFIMNATNTPEVSDTGMFYVDVLIVANESLLKASNFKSNNKANVKAMEDTLIEQGVAPKVARETITAKIVSQVTDTIKVAKFTL